MWGLNPWPHSGHDIESFELTTIQRNRHTKSTLNLNLIIQRSEHFSNSVSFYRSSIIVTCNEFLWSWGSKSLYYLSTKVNPDKMVLRDTFDSMRRNRHQEHSRSTGVRYKTETCKAICSISANMRSIFNPCLNNHLLLLFGSTTVVGQGLPVPLMGLAFNDFWTTSP